ncbi:MAG: F0F1 ATP synthase subunit B [Armatimonadetes bacterium]|nr:F0F1 ATP synthase subunit B [Armatimonadota bacterium]
MSTEKKSPFIRWIPKLIIGVSMMIGGMYVSINVHLEFVDKVNGMGIPLDIGKTIATIGVFLIVFPLIESFYLNPLKESILNRTQALQQTFEEAENMRAEMDATKEEYEARLAETEASAREQIQAEIKKAQELRKTIQAEASAQADELLAKAREEIASERDRALVDMRVHVATLSFQATEMILEENMNNERNRKLIDDFIDQVEVSEA